MFERFIKEERASSEAVAHGVLFVFMIGLITSLSVVGGDAIDEVENTQSVEMGVNGFVNAHEKAVRFTKIGSENEYATSGLQTNVKSINAQIRSNNDTDITIQSSSGETYDLTSEPLVMDHDDYNIYYDSGVVSEVSDTNSTRVLHWTPVDNYPSRDGVLQLTTSRVEDGSTPVNDDVNSLFIRQQEPPETMVVNDGAWVNVTTETQYGWKNFLDRYEFLEIDSATTQPSGEKQINARVDIDSDDEVLIQHVKVSMRFA